MDCGYKIVLSKDMSYGWTYSSGVHIFQDDMSYGSICLMEVMLCRRKCLVGGHVLVECMFSGWDILQYVVFYWKTFLTS